MTMRTIATLDRRRARVPAGLHAAVEGDPSAPVRAITHDTRAVVEGGMYACLRGTRFDGHALATDAVAAGAANLLVAHPLAGPGIGASVSQLVVADTRVALGPVAAAVQGDPSTALRVVGITGTNGKTTTSALLASILRGAGDPTSVIGTLSGAHTTPEAPELQARLAGFRDAGDLSVVMEVSSHALALHRVDGTRFDAAVFTNLGRDHLDLHGTPEAYFRAKAMLFDPTRAVVGVVNTDDAHGRQLYDAGSIEMVGFSRADATDIEVGPARLSFRWRGHGIGVHLGGPFNVMNALAAATTAEALGITVDTIVAGLAAAPAVPGRFERVVSGRPNDRARAVDVIVDYAHTPDGLEEVIAAGGAVVGDHGRVIVVFGAGGDRDRDKRPLMGAAAARLADVTVITSDNPRSEDPEAIMADIVAGIPPEQRSQIEIVPDRAEAIRIAIGLAEPGDIVIIAGKGHETTQTIGSDVVAFDDRAVARAVLEGAS
ncbi:UDP-N-acetylmuramoyl-L-alanyl-D-glutamate--2,6-diaminopimelate ligase [soil metagenome]